MCVYDGSNIKTYVNGNLEDAKSNTGLIVSSGNLIIGSDIFSTASRVFNGSIDDVQIYNRALSADEVGALYDASSSQYSQEFTGLSDLATYNYEVFAQDAAGNVTSAGQQSFSIQLNVAPNAPTLVSPANASYTNDTTPTLSASYADDDTGDVGTTEYRIASSSLSDCVNNSHIVASGSSAETTSNTETTSWTPSSSIGSDRTYYWCARNTDGTNASSWTQMGSFTIDTEAPLQLAPPPLEPPVITDVLQEISVFTSEDASCKVSLTQQAYGDMSGEVCTGS